MDDTIPVTKSQDMHQSTLRMIRFLWRNPENTLCLPHCLNSNSTSDNLLPIHLVSNWSLMLVASSGTLCSCSSQNARGGCRLCAKGWGCAKGGWCMRGMILHKGDDSTWGACYSRGWCSARGQCCMRRQCYALKSISHDSVTGIKSFAGYFIGIPWRIVLYIESTKILDIGRNFSYFLNLQYESRRLSSYLLRVNIDRTWARLEDGRTDGRNIFRPRNYETRRDEVENFGRLFGHLSSYRWTIANPDQIQSPFTINIFIIVVEPDNQIRNEGMYKDMSLL